MKLPWAPRGHMLLFLIEEAFQLLHRVLSLVSGQSAIRNGVRQSSVVSGPVLLSSDNSQSAIRNPKLALVLRFSDSPFHRFPDSPVRAVSFRISHSAFHIDEMLPFPVSPFLRFAVSPFRAVSFRISHSAFHIDEMLPFPVSPFLRFAVSPFRAVSFRISHSAFHIDEMLRFPVSHPLSLAEPPNGLPAPSS
jgi:hypothetical protein